MRAAIKLVLLGILLCLSATAVRADSIEKLDAWTAATQMGIGINIGNTLENTTQWETGWGNPPITKEYVESLAALGFKTVRLPVAWDTYARDGVISAREVRARQRGGGLDHRRRDVLRHQHPLGWRLDRFEQQGEVRKHIRHVQCRCRAQISLVLDADRQALRGSE